MTNPPPYGSPTGPDPHDPAWQQGSDPFGKGQQPGQHPQDPYGQTPQDPYGQYPPSQYPPGQYPPAGYGQPPGWVQPPGYGPGPGGFGGPPPYGMPIPNYLWQSIVVTVLCCLPAGIPAIVYSTRVQNLQQMGDIQGALDASRKARTWCIVSAGVTAAALVLYIIVVIIAVAAGS